MKQVVTVARASIAYVVDSSEQTPRSADVRFDIEETGSGEGA